MMDARVVLTWNDPEDLYHDWEEWTDFCLDANKAASPKAGAEHMTVKKIELDYSTVGIQIQ